MDNYTDRNAYLPGSAGLWITKGFAVASILALLYSYKVAYCAWLAHDLDSMALLLAGWAFVPPAWFWIEYFWIYRNPKNGDPAAFESFKYGQQLSIGIWAGLALALAAAVASEHFKTPATKESVVTSCLCPNAPQPQR
jgi:hypothetical protein